MRNDDSTAGLHPVEARRRVHLSGRAVQVIPRIGVTGATRRKATYT
jgi:hypothetical protein